MVSESAADPRGEDDSPVRSTGRRMLLPAGVALLALAAACYLFGVPIWFLAVSAAAVTVSYKLIPGRKKSSISAAAPHLPSAWPNTDIKAVTSAIRDPAFIIDREGIVRFRNQAAEAAFPSARPGDPLRFRIRAGALAEGVDTALSTGEPVTVEFHQRFPSENHYSASIVTVDNQGRKGQSQFFLIVLDDQTEQRSLERMRSDFVANASHELRTPLASLSGFIETLQGAARNDPDARAKFLVLMQEQAIRMARLIEDLLSLSRIEMRAHLLPDGEADVGEIIAHVTDVLRPHARESGLEIINEVDDALPTVGGDRDELVEVVENLVGNAIKYGASGERIIVRARMSETASGMVQVDVEDFGPGIAADHIPRLTERFYRVPSNAKQQHKSTGLGLAIVKHIITRHRGRLQIESEVGAGSVFSFHIPVKSTQISESVQIDSLS